jgi:hypothetical protein
MDDENRPDRGFLKIGGLDLPRLPMPNISASMPPTQPTASGTIGATSLGPKGGSSPGQEHGATGAEATPISSSATLGSRPLENPRSRSSTQDLRQQRASIAALIARLLSHYWAGDDPPETRRAQAEDWIEDLLDFDLGIVAEACAQWRRGMSRRPTPADIRRLAIAEQGDRNEQLRLTAPTDMDAYAKSLGWASAAARLADIKKAKQRDAERDGRA